MRALKESWKEAPQAIEELEKEGEVLVTRTVKDGQLRMVFWNEIKPTEESGGMPVEKGIFWPIRCMFMIAQTPLRISRSMAFSQSTKRCGSIEAVVVRYFFPFYVQCLTCFTDNRRRGFTSYCSRVTRTKGANCQKERQTWWRASTTPGPYHEYTSQRRNRPSKRLRRSFQVDRF